MNHYRAVCRSARNKTVHGKEQEMDEYTEGDSQIDMVNIDFINSNVQSLGITAKLKTSSYQNSVNISYKTDTGRNSNILPFYIYKILSSKSTKSYYHELKVKTLKLKTYKNQADRILLFNINA